MKSSFGTNFTLTIFGESHGPAVGFVLDGLPAGIRLDLDLGKKAVILHAVAAKRVICGMDIHSYIDYTCHDDSSSCMW